VSFGAAVLLPAVAVLIAGCGGSAPTPKQPQASNAVPRLTPPPARQVPVDEPEPEPPPQQPAARRPIGPWLEFRVADSDLIEAKGYLRLVAAPGFGSVLELSSYDTPDHETFPALYLRSITTSNNLAGLVSTKLAGDLYIMVEKDGNVIHSLPSRPVQLLISEIDGKNVRGTFAGQVYDIDAGEAGPISGKFQAIVEP
jgi:hypothetical protein